MKSLTIEEITKEYEELCKKYKFNLPLLAYITKYYLEMIDEIQEKERTSQN